MGNILGKQIPVLHLGGVTDHKVRLEVDELTFVAILTEKRSLVEWLTTSALEATWQVCPSIDVFGALRQLAELSVIASYLIKVLICFVLLAGKKRLLITNWAAWHKAYNFSR